MDPINNALDFLLKHEAGISQSIIATLGFARLITALTPTKRDDKILARPEMWWRKVLDLITGAVHQPLIESSTVDNAGSQGSATSDELTRPTIKVSPEKISLDNPVAPMQERVARRDGRNLKLRVKPDGEITLHIHRPR